MSILTTFFKAIKNSCFIAFLFYRLIFIKKGLCNEKNNSFSGFINKLADSSS